VLFCVLFVCKCVLPPGDNPTVVYIYIYQFIVIRQFMLVHYFVSIRARFLGHETFDIVPGGFAKNFGLLAKPEPQPLWWTNGAGR
jgi:hypothetical protein